MAAFPLALAAALPLALVAGDEKSFFHLPGEGDFRWQAIERADNEKDWPFTVDKGYLSCVYIVGERTAYFVEKRGDGEEASDYRAVVISTNAFDLSLGNLGKTDLFDRTVGLEELIRRISPFVQVGRKLCDQPRGTEIGPGEL